MWLLYVWAKTNGAVCSGCSTICGISLLKCSEQWICLFCSGLVGPRYFQLLFVALMCTSWSFDMVFINI
ncbi:hypothetical protein BHE74_00037342 [Ensete ventricosum]|nr:hypothetical protein GW17_00049645 [Ensete ventricosum]RWW55969.1 hypothetical protein BHE74_00037342 [Ensete ventricosum]RZR99397.1 hypothetical protein BHM03_00028921 [Ensete ventricosum]